MNVVEKFLEGSKLALSKAISMVERGEGFKLLKEIASRKASQDYHIIGITGPPGVGKSTFIAGAIDKLAEDEVAALLIDPSSVRAKGGAILGDRIRMGRYSNNVFIRSVGTRDGLGALSSYTTEILKLFVLFGFKWIIVETAGAGHGDIDVKDIADTVVLIISPEGGDEIQFMKAGIMEIANIFVVNKADRPGADKICDELKNSIKVSTSIVESMKKDTGWTPKVIKTISSENVGIDEAINNIREHRNYLLKTGELEKRRNARKEKELKEIVLRVLMKKLSPQLINKALEMFGDDIFSAAEWVISNLK